jgi:hypothetical protein
MIYPQQNIRPTNECNLITKIVIILSNYTINCKILETFFISAKTDRFLKSNPVEDFARLKGITKRFLSKMNYEVIE